MAAIDNTYVTAQELKEAIAWAKEVGTCTLDNGYKFKPFNFIIYNDLDNPDFDWNREEYVLWNTPLWFDRWLWLNCPLEFVKDRLKFQYGDDALKEFENYVYHNPKDNLDFGNQHYTFLKVPKWKNYKWWMNNARRLNPWPDKCKQLTYFIEIVAPNNEWRNDLQYCSQLDCWVKDFEYLAHDNEYIWQKYHKNIPNKKSIIRELRRWYIPKGYIVKVRNLKYIGLDFEILVK